MEAVLEAGADDLTVVDDVFEVVCLPENFMPVKEALDAQEIQTLSAEIAMIPKTTVDVEGKQAEQVLKLMDGLDDCDDVQSVHSNFNVPEEG